MKLSLKIALSLLIAIIIFTVFFIIASSGLFKVVESVFYIPRIKAEFSNSIERIVSEIEKYHQAVFSRFRSILKNDFISSAFLQNQNNTDAIQRDNAFGKLMQDHPELIAIRFISQDAKFIYYSTLKSDLKVDRIDQRMYFPLDQVEKNIASNAFVSQKNDLPKVIIDSTGNRLIYSFPISDEFDIYKGTALFFIAESDIEKLLITIKGSMSGDYVSFVDNRGILIGIPSEKIKNVKDEIVSSWNKNIGKKSYSEIIGAAIKGQNASEAYILFSRNTDRYGIVSIVAPKNIFEIGAIQKIIINILFFITIFLIIFVIFNIKQDPLSVLSERIKYLQISFIKQFIESKDEINWERWHKELASKRPEIAKYIKRGIGRVSNKQKTEIDALINRGWDEILSIVSKKSEHEKDYDVTRIEEIIIRAFKQGNIVIPVKQTADVSERKASIESKIIEPKDAREHIPSHEKKIKDIEKVSEPNEIPETAEVEADAEEIEEIEEAEQAEEVTEVPEEIGKNNEAFIDNSATAEEMEEIAEAEPVEEVADVPAEINKNKASFIETDNSDSAEEIEEIGEISESRIVPERSDQSEYTGEEGIFPDFVSIEDEKIEDISELENQVADDITRQTSDLDKLEESLESISDVEAAEKRGVVKEKNINTNEEISKRIVEDVDLEILEEVTDESDGKKYQESIGEYQATIPIKTLNSDDVDRSQFIGGDKSSSKIIAMSEEKAENIKQLLNRVSDEINKKDKTSGSIQDIEIANKSLLDVGESIPVLESISEINELEPEVFEDLPELELAENPEEYLNYNRGGKFHFLLDSVMNIDGLEVKSDEAKSRISMFFKGESVNIGAFKYEEGKKCVLELINKTPEPETSTNIQALQFANFKVELKMLLDSKKMLVYSLSDVFSMYTSMKKAIVIEDGVYRIKKDLYIESGEGSNEELMDLVRAVNKENERENEPQDYKNEERILVGHRIFENISHKIVVTPKGIDYDRYLKQLSVKADDIAVIKSLITISKRLDSTCAGILIFDGNNYKLEYSVGLQDKTKDMLKFSENNPYSSIFFNNRVAFILNIPTDQVQSLRGLFFDYDRRFLQGLVFLPVFFKQKECFIFLGFPKFINRELKTILIGLGI
jgi:hypothetical protein